MGVILYCEVPHTIAEEVTNVCVHTVHTQTRYFHNFSHIINIMLCSDELSVSRYVAESITMIAGHFGHQGLCQNIMQSL